MALLMTPRDEPMIIYDGSRIDQERSSQVLPGLPGLIVLGARPGQARPGQARPGQAVLCRPHLLCSTAVPGWCLRLCCGPTGSLPPPGCVSAVLCLVVFSVVLCCALVVLCSAVSGCALLCSVVLCCALCCALLCFLLCSVVLCCALLCSAVLLCHSSYCGFCCNWLCSVVLCCAL
jgi:hypothetical protein